MLARETGHLVIIDDLRVGGHVVRHEAELLAGETGRAAVGEVATMGQIHAQDRVAKLQQGVVHRHVGRAAGVGLDVGVLGAEQRLGPFDGERLDVVDDADALVVPAARIPFGVLGIQVGGERLQDGRRSIVLAGDEIERLVVADVVALEQRRDLGIIGLQARPRGAVGLADLRLDGHGLQVLPGLLEPVYPLPRGGPDLHAAPPRRFGTSTADSLPGADVAGSILPSAILLEPSGMPGGHSGCSAAW